MLERQSHNPGSDITLSSGPREGYLELAASFSEVAVEDVARPAAAFRRAPCDYVGSWTTQEGSLMFRLELHGRFAATHLSDPTQ